MTAPDLSKGSGRRPTDEQAYAEGYDRIFGKHPVREREGAESSADEADEAPKPISQN